MNGDTCLQSALTACSGCEPTVLNASQLHCLEKAFDTWVARAKGSRSIVARNRARLVFMLLRYTGAKLGEILELDDRTDFALAYRKVVLGNRTDEGKNRREVYLPESLHNELKQVIRNSDYASLRGVIFRLDQGYMRKIINNRAGECGIPKPLANPNTLRRSQAVELLQDGMPLMVVQGLLGHHTYKRRSNNAPLERPNSSVAPVRKCTG